jgi:adenylosuccinate synthase
MVDRIILLSGPVSSGKSTLAKGLASRYNMAVCKTVDLLRTRIAKNLTSNRKVLQAEGEALDHRTGGKWVCDVLSAYLREKPETSAVIVDAVRIAKQIQVIREAFGQVVTHVHLTAPEGELRKRYAKRTKTKPDVVTDYAQVRNNNTERQVETLADIADIVIDTNRCNEDDILVRTAAHLSIRDGRGMGYVDLVIGGQYGSEGKGQIAAYLAPEYDVLVRVGGPNAGHKVFEVEEPYTYHHLPSGTLRNQGLIVIGPGGTLNVHGSNIYKIKGLLKEIAERGVDSERLKIDRKAMIITDDDIAAEEELQRRIGSTRQGVGAASARRIMERFPETRLARDIPELRPYICDTVEVLSSMLRSGKRVLLEGTQGTALSIFHGMYPYVTSRDTTAMGCISEAGIPPSRVRRVVMVCRTYPIRVQSPPKGTSGPMSQPISLAEVSRRSGIPLPILQKTERTSTTNRKRRIAEFDWFLLRKAALINGPTDIALTFADYLCAKNGDARRFDQLEPGTIKFIQEVERIAEAPVSLISTGFNFHSVIDRRSW